jgi:hypothetical protein
MTRKYGTTWAHLHLPRAKRGDYACISVKTGAQPVEYAGCLALRDVVFNVREAGRQATLRTGVKNVHAWVTGERMHAEEVMDTLAMGTSLKDPRWVEIKYNPRRAATFTDPDGVAVVGAEYVWMTGTKVYAWSPVYAFPTYWCDERQAYARSN